MSTGITKEKFIPGEADIKTALDSIKKQFDEIAIAVEKIATESAKISKNVGAGNSLKETINASKQLNQLKIQESNLEKVAIDIRTKKHKLVMLQKKAELEAEKQLNAEKAKKIKEDRSKELAEQKEILKQKEAEAAAEKQLAAEQKKLNELNAQSLKIHTAIQQKKIAEQKKAEAAAEKQLNTQTKRTVQDKKQLIIAMNAEKNSITQLSAMNKVLEARMKQLNVAIPAQKVQFDNLSKAVLRNQSVMQKNVADIRNTTSGFNGLQFQVTQLARELPALAYGPQMFIAAISNNLPMMQEELKRAKIANDALRKSGQQAIPIWKQFAKAIVSWQTATIVLMTAYMLFSKEINNAIKSLFNYNRSVNIAKETQKALNSAIDEGASAIGDETSKLKALYFISQDESRSKNDRLMAVNELQKIYPDYLGNIEDEEFLVGGAYKQYQLLTDAILDNAIAKAKLNEVTKIGNDIYEDEKKLFKTMDLIAYREERIKMLELQKSLTVSERQELQGHKDIIKSDKRKRDAILKNIADHAEKANRIIGTIKPSEIIDPEKPDSPNGGDKVKDDRLAILKAQQEARMQMLIQWQQNEIALYADSTSDMKIIDFGNKKDQLLLESRFIDEQLGIVENGSVKYYEILADREKNIAQLKENNAEYLLYVDESMRKYEQENMKASSDAIVEEAYRAADHAKAVDSQLALIKINSRKHSNKEIEKLQRELALNEIGIEIGAARAIIEASDVLPEEKKKQLDRLEQLYKQFYDKLIDNSKQSDQDQLEIWRDFASGMADIIGEVAGLFDALQERQLQDAKELYEAQIRYAGTSIEKRLLAEKQYEKEQAKIKKRMAIAEKAEALFNIAMRIAELAPKAAAGDVGSILGIIAGGIATGTVLATGIPAYEKGTGHAESTFIAGEAGTEAIIKDGKVVLTPNKATLFNDPALSGATVLPHDETQRMLANYALRQSYDMIDLSSTNKHLKSIDKNTKSQQSVTFDSKGRKILKRGYITTVIT
jgi:hypothetical protein